ncbi:MAG: thiamine pyrophosphate-binding protein [Lachnospiraceae bacterium]|nr:thiamine pyrophosphate-binding protein [Lachnospiraceae bacterium]
MKLKISEYIAEFLIERGVETIFTVTGGGAMHLNDAFGHHPELKCIYNHHEQASAMAAEGYARLTGDMAAVCVTSGPGGTNAITGVFDCWVDSIPMFVVSGQVKRETTVRVNGLSLRQLGDQECDIAELVKSITKFSVMITNPNEIRYQLEKAWYLATNGRKGPVWVDVPLDVQAAVIDTDFLTGFDPANTALKEHPYYDRIDVDRILERIEQSRRPVILAGEGIRLGEAYKEFLETTNALKVPVLAAWNAQDVLWEDNPYFVGIPGTVGERGANFILQNADLLLVLGCRMNIRMVGYNRGNFAEKAYKIQVDIDEKELCKPTVKVDMPIHADVKDVCRELANAVSEEVGDHSKWLRWCKGMQKKYDPVLKEYFNTDEPMNPYAFLSVLSDELPGGEVVSCGNGAACVQSFQAIKLKKGTRIFTNSGSAAMGCGFPMAMGAALGRKGRRVVCIDGDGSFMMNMQELETIAYYKPNLKLIILNNNGYHSIRQTQHNLFKGRPLVGVSKENGVGFPDFLKVVKAFGLKCIRVASLSAARKEIPKFLEMEGPVVMEAVVDDKQNFEPKLSSKVDADGKLVSSPLDDMFPFIDRKEYERICEEALSI